MKRSQPGIINDFYNSLWFEIKSILKEKIEPAALAEAVYKNLNRKRLQKVYMPQVYGKTMHSAAADIHSNLSTIIKKNESYSRAKAFYPFWELRFPSINMLMKLVNEVAWFAATLDKPVNSPNYL